MLNAYRCLVFGQTAQNSTMRRGPAINRVPAKRSSSGENYR